MTYGPYLCTVKRIIDGDTVIVDIDCGFYIHTHQSIRLADIDAPELYTSDPLERERGRSARAYVESIMPVGTPLTLITDKDRRSFNRYVGTLYFADGRSVSSMIVEAGHAVYRDK